MDEAQHRRVALASERHFANNLIFYRGESQITGEPILGIAGRETSNPKTGPVVQVWILREDLSPIAAVKNGMDRAICGGCSHRGDGQGNARSCYVEYFRAPFNLWRALRSTGREIAPKDLADKLNNKHARLGAYGDPAAIPIDIWRTILTRTSGWTAYTHQWRTCDPAFRSIAMASVENEDEQQHARRLGWRTFRVRTAGEPTLPNEIVCPASAEGGHAAQCASCGLCCGSQRAAKSIAIIAHGSGATHFANRKLNDRPSLETGSEPGPRPARAVP